MNIALIYPIRIDLSDQHQIDNLMLSGLLEEELKQKGHQVFAFGKSLGVADIDGRKMKSQQEDKLVTIGKVITAIIKSGIRFDIVHNCAGWQFFPFLELLGVPTVSTLIDGLSRNIKQKKIIASFRHFNLVSTSNNQRDFFAGNSFLANCYFPLPFDDFVIKKQPRNYFAYYGELDQKSGVLAAIEIAKRAGIVLMIGGGIGSSEGDFFQEKVKRHIDGKYIRFVGELQAYQKEDFFGNARALLACYQRDDDAYTPLLEALACGTPVIGYAKGAVPEIIQHQKNGFVCASINEAIESLDSLNKINREYCAQDARCRFAVEKITGEYLRVYDKVIVSEKK